MYCRPLIKAPEHIVQNGKINFGSYAGVSSAVDIRGVKAPFAGIPTSTLFSNFRIKSRVCFVFSVENYIGLAEFFDDKAFGLAEVIFWNKESGQKLAYHSFMGPRKRFVPTNTYEASCNTFGKSRYIKISWSRKRKKISLTFTVRGDKFRPAVKAKYLARLEEDSKEVLFVNPAPTTQRCSATWLIPLILEGGLNTGKHRHNIKEIPKAKGLGLFMLNRTYLKPRSSSIFMYGLANINGKNVIFSVSNTSQDSLDEDTYNDNFLSVDETLTALPPVKITNPFGIEKKWVAQDTEGMVDLSFNPISVSNRTLDILIMRNVYTTIYGTFDGVLVSDSGEKIVLKNCSGIVKKSHIRL